MHCNVLACVVVPRYGRREMREMARNAGSEVTKCMLFPTRPQILQLPGPQGISADWLTDAAGLFSSLLCNPQCQEILAEYWEGMDARRGAEMHSPGGGDCQLIVRPSLVGKRRAIKSNRRRLQICS